MVFISRDDLVYVFSLKIISSPPHTSNFSKYNIQHFEVFFSHYVKENIFWGGEDMNDILSYLKEENLLVEWPF